MRSKFNGFLTLLLAFVVQLTFAQSKTISGNVSDSTGPLPGVVVLIKGTQTGTETDFDGNYSIQAKPRATLVFSYIGMKTTEQTVGNSNTMNITLQEDMEALEEVVVTGQGSGMQKRRLSTTVDALSSKQLEKLPSKQIDQILQSTTPSAQIRLSSGQPGTAAIIRTRGPISAASSSTPVVIVDGIRVDNLNSNPELGLDTGGANVSALADIPVESIERIEYIKGGAATTLYGADAANGVIQIITKKGTQGKPTIIYESSLGLIKGTTDFLKYKRTSEALFETGVSQQQRISINGGNEKVTYNFGGSIYADDGFNDVNEQIKKSFTFGLGAQITDKLKYQGSFSYVGFKNKMDFNANTSFGRYGNLEGTSGDLDEMDDADWLELKSEMQAIGGLVDISNEIKRFTASNKFTYDIDQNNQINATYGIDYRTTAQEENDTNALLVALGSESVGTTDKATLERVLRSSFTTTADINFTNKTSIENLSFVSIIGAQYFRTEDEQNNIAGSGGVDGTKSISTFPTQTAADFTLQNANYGFYFLENIGIHDIAFVELGGRFDKNTSAGTDTDVLFLPKIGFTYNLSDHEFYGNSKIRDIVSSVKLRANYGEATNFAEPFSQDRTFGLQPFLGQPSFRFDNPGNEDLVSERVKTSEIGLELGFINNKINFSTTYYKAITEDALFTPSQPPSSGLLAQIKNIGEIKNTGWEFALNATILNSRDHRLTANVSYNNNKNIVTSMGGAAPFNVGGFSVIGSWVEEGKSLGYLRGTSAAKDSNGDWQYTPNTNLGDTYAPNFGSFGFNYTFKDLDLFLTGDYQFGGQAVELNFLLRHLYGFDSTGIPEAIDGQTSPFNYVNYFTFDSDFVKIRNIGISYNLKDKIPFIQNTKLSFSVTNPLNWTAGNFDPESTGSGISGQNGFSSGGFAFGTESAPRTFNTSIKFQF
ncbi:TonB-dependent receptor domain-containing protein [Bacteroidota bacterium]